MECAVWFQTIILAITAALVCWYTVETGKLRREMVRQNEISLRPVIVPIFDTSGPKHVFKLHNIGAGSAFNLTVEPIEILPALDAGAAGPKAEIKFDALSYLPSGQISEVRFSPWSTGKENPSYGDCAPDFFPGYTHAERIMKIFFGDVEAGKYEQAIRIKPSTFDSAVRTIDLEGIRKLSA